MGNILNLNIENTTKNLKIEDNIEILNFEDTTKNLKIEDNIEILNFEDTTKNLGNICLETYDYRWFYWRVVLDFFYSHDSDVFGEAH